MSRTNGAHCHIADPRCFEGFSCPHVSCIVLASTLLGDFASTLLSFVFTSNFSTTLRNTRVISFQIVSLLTSPELYYLL